MKGKRHRPEQIIGKLREADVPLATGATIGQVCQKPAVSEQAFHRCRNRAVRLQRLWRPGGHPPVPRAGPGLVQAERAVAGLRRRPSIVPNPTYAGAATPVARRLR